MAFKEGHFNNLTQYALELDESDPTAKRFQNLLYQVNAKSAYALGIQLFISITELQQELKRNIQEFYEQEENPKQSTRLEDASYLMDIFDRNFPAIVEAHKEFKAAFERDWELSIQKTEPDKEEVPAAI